MSPGILVDSSSERAAKTAHSTSLNDALSISPHSFLQPTPELHQASLEVAKQYLDPLAKSVGEYQLARLQDTRKKRKRNEREDFETRDILRLKQLHLAGFSVDQVWEQARKVIDASHREAQHLVRRAEAGAREPQQLLRPDPPGASKSKKDGSPEKLENESVDVPIELEESEPAEPEAESAEGTQDSEDEDIRDDLELEDIGDETDGSAGENDADTTRYVKSTLR